MRAPYQTRQREALLACFAAQPRELLTAQQVHALLLEQGEPIGQTTVYRLIARLVAEGRIMEIKNPGGGAAKQYQHLPKSPKHLSVRCFGCGLIAQLDCAAVEAFEKHLELGHGFSLMEGEALLPCICAACKQETTKQTGKTT